MSLVSIQLIPDETGFWRDLEVQPGNLAKSLAHTAVDDPIGANDGDSSTILAAQVDDGGRTSLKFPAPNLIGAANIQSIDHVDLHILVRRTNIGSGPPNWRPFIYDNIDGHLVDFVLGPLTTAYVDVLSTFTTNPLTSLAWDKDHFNARRIEFGVQREPEGLEQVIRVTQLYLEVWYNAAAWSSLPPATGSWTASSKATGTWITMETPSGTWTKA